MQTPLLSLEFVFIPVKTSLEGFGPGLNHFGIVFLHPPSKRTKTSRHLL